MMTWLARFVAGLLIGALVLLALAVGGLRLSIAYIEYFEPEIQSLLERELLPGIVFSRLDGTMDRFNPVLSIENVSITLPDRSQPLFIDRLQMEFDFFASLVQRRPVVHEISGQIEKLELVKDEAGHWWISDLAIAFDPERGPGPGFRKALDWVPSYLKLDMKRMVVLDRQTSEQHQFTDVSAQINHQQERYFVRFDASLPGQLGRSLLIKSIVGAERSLVYVNSSNLQLTPIARLIDIDTRGLRQGSLDGEIWINLAGYDVTSVNGNLVLRDGVVQMANDKSPLEVSYHSRFSAVNRGLTWLVSNGFDQLQVNGRNVAGFRSQIEVSKQPGSRLFWAWVDRVPLESLPVVAGQWLPAEINRQISGGHLDGELRDVLLRVDFNRPERFLFGARARGVSSKAFSRYPGAANLDAEVLMSHERFGARLYGDNVSLDFGDHFSAPFELDRLEADASGERGAQGLVLAIDNIRLRNADLSAVGRAWLEFDQDQRPFAFIRARFENGRGSSISKYLPRQFMPQRTQQWLDRGIKRGHVPAGEMQFHGRLRDIRQPEQHQAVAFYVDFRVEDAEVLFSPDWLPAKNGNGRVLFHNVGMHIDLDRVDYDRIENARARAVVEDFRKPVLNLRIETESSTRDAVQSWVATPVGRQFYEAVRNFEEFGGRVATGIEIALPLTGNTWRPQTSVTVDFDGASAVSNAWALQLSRVNGRLRASGGVLHAKQIEARYFDDPVTVDIEGSPADGHTRVSAQGLIDTANLVRKLPTFLARAVSGKSDWRIDMDFSPPSRGVDEPVMRLQASSQLQESVIALPRPLAKPAGQTLPVTASVDFHARHMRFLSRIGDRLHSRGKLDANGQNRYRLSELDLAFASKLVEKPRPGVHLYGFIDEIFLDDWMQILDFDAAVDDIMLQTARLEIARLHALDRDIGDLQIDLQQRNQRFIGGLVAPAISGSLDLPRHPTPLDPAVIDLEYLRIDKPQAAGRQPSLTPDRLVDFHLSSKVLLYHDMMFQNLQVQARADGNRLYLDKLGLQRDDLVMKGRGQWDYDAKTDSHLSSVTLTVKGPGLGQAIDGIGFGDTMNDGTLDFQGGISWPAPITAFDFARLSGDARLTIENGVLNNVEPGSGRFVGLLSLSALPRRLSLDFSDVLIKGMEFSKISGTYRIEDGVLYTRDTRMDGPAASIKISGRTSITERSYDQNIRVTPKIRQTLPVIGAVSAGSTVGWGLLLLQNLFKKVIDDAVEVEYQVTGSWDDPKIELIKAVDENQRELPKKDEIPNLDD